MEARETPLFLLREENRLSVAVMGPIPSQETVRRVVLPRE